MVNYLPICKYDSIKYAKMQKRSHNLSPAELGLALKRAFEARGITQPYLQARTGIDQSQISRIFNGRFRRVDGNNVQKLCKYANIANKKSRPPPPDPRKSDLLMKALSAVWDGSAKKERALAELICSLEPLLRHD